MTHYKYGVLFTSILALFLTGCSNAKIVIPSYSPPKEYKKLSEIENGGDMREGTYMAIAINPEIAGEATADKKKIDSILINAIKQGLTETNFITIYPIFDTANVSLNMQIISYEYEKSENNIKADMQVSFTITKGITEYLSKTYSAKANRYSSNANNLPSKSKVLLDLGKDVSKKFISDITPLKTRQLREFLAMPSDLEYIITYAKRGNFESAVEDMEDYDGNKDLNYYYNLAVLYEGLGSKTGSMETFSKAKKAYSKAMRQGGSSNDLVINAKSRFDNFYRLFQMTQNQKGKNKNLRDELDDMYGQTE